MTREELHREAAEAEKDLKRLRPGFTASEKHHRLWNWASNQSTGLRFAKGEILALEKALGEIAAECKGIDGASPDTLHGRLRNIAEIVRRVSRTDRAASPGSTAPSTQREE